MNYVQQERGYSSSIVACFVQIKPLVCMHQKAIVRDRLATVRHDQIRLVIESIISVEELD